MTDTSPYHAGERRVQERAGETATADRNGGVIANAMPIGALPFVGQQSMLVLGSVDPDGETWASVLFGRPGFATAPDPRSLEIDLGPALVDERDPFWSNIEGHPRVGVLAIELGSRRRLRVNGPVTRSGPRLELSVDEAYPNCPKYIQRRHLDPTSLDATVAAGDVRTGELLDDALSAWITGADTFFVASAHSERGVDASHRGGLPGFVQVLDERTLRIPDYAGNSMFNTLGNLDANPRAGLAFVDFEGGRVLQLIGRGTVRWDLEDVDGVTGGTRRFWDFEVTGWRATELPAALRWEFLDASPFNPRPTGEAGEG